MITNSKPAGGLTGRHVLAMFLGAFGVIIAVNLVLAFTAVRTFSGMEVANSYVASQSFDRRREAQEALGWTPQVSYADGILRLAVHDAAGGTVDPARFSAVVGRPTMRRQDHALDFDARGRAPLLLAPGRWRIDLQGETGGAPFVQALTLEVAP
ncbi:FixH family protein [Pseudoroseicyclus aestuarii]|uniref:Nitrogen fixation protein FixH n=1 Tax=Pseudoroseicyclus aestuarii TaxID=1795041 RepID=A0A318SPD3_9RHOB|nr:FixH family protein [Pseudoroseicyclus aestuarii]PYE82455.1 nitrogen fixation protein FixH [Pseudoroseicyclus aestuarii]